MGQRRRADSRADQHDRSTNELTDGLAKVVFDIGFGLVVGGLLPGALIRNQSLRFVCKPVWLRVESNRTPFTANLEIQRLLRMPVAHGEGSYFADETTLARIESKKLVVLNVAKNKWLVSSGMISMRS